MATYSALPATLNLVATVGNDFTLSLTVTESGSPWVATGATLATDIIDSSGTVVATDFTTAASTGAVSLSLTDTQTGTLGVGVYSYRLSVTKSSLTRDWIAGTLSIVEAGQGGTSTSSASLSISNSAVSLSLTSLVAPLAENISVADAGGYYAGTTVEAVLTEIATRFHVVVNPVTYGADPTGSADSATAFQAAANVALTNDITLRPSPGTYKLRNVRIYPGTTVDLSDVTLTYGGTNGTSGPVEAVPTILYVSGSASPLAQGIRITGGTIVGGRPSGDYTNISGTTSEDSLYFYQAQDVVVDGVTFVDSGQDAVSFDSCAGGVVQNCRFTGVGDSSIDLRSGTGYRILNNQFTTCRNIVSSKSNLDDVIVAGNTGSTFQQGIVGHGTRWTITDNRITAVTTSDGIAGSAVQAIQITTDGVTSPNNQSDIVIRGNVISGRTSSNAIELTTAGAETLTNVIIAGNQITSCNRGVFIGKGANVNVYGNYISSTLAGVWASAGSKVTIADNDITTASAVGIDTSLADTVIVGNRINSGAGGISATSAATKSRIANNHIVAAGVGIALSGTSQAATGNTITTSASEGIQAANSNQLVNGNMIAATAEGVKITGNGVCVTGNTVTLATQGVRVTANDCVVTGNRLTGASFFGVTIAAGSTDTVVVGNDLKGNTSGGLNDAGTTTQAASNRP